MFSENGHTKVYYQGLLNLAGSTLLQFKASLALNSKAVEFWISAIFLPVNKSSTPTSEFLALDRLINYLLLGPVTHDYIGCPVNGCSPITIANIPQI